MPPPTSFLRHCAGVCIVKKCASPCAHKDGCRYEMTGACLYATAAEKVAPVPLHSRGHFFLMFVSAAPMTVSSGVGRLFEEHLCFRRVYILGGGLPSASALLNGLARSANEQQKKITRTDKQTRWFCARTTMPWGPHGCSCLGGARTSQLVVRCKSSFLSQTCSGRRQLAPSCTTCCKCILYRSANSRYPLRLRWWETSLAVLCRSLIYHRHMLCLIQLGRAG